MKQKNNYIQRDLKKFRESYAVASEYLLEEGNVIQPLILKTTGIDVHNTKINTSQKIKQELVKIFDKVYDISNLINSEKNVDETLNTTIRNAMKLDFIRIPPPYRKTDNFYELTNKGETLVKRINEYIN